MNQPHVRNGLLFVLGCIAIGVLLFLVSRCSRDNQVASDEPATPQIESAGADPARLCASGDVYDQIKVQLFKGAAQLRGRDEAAFDQLAAFATLRVDRSVVTGTDSDGSANCSASISLDIPPGLVAVGGRRTLTGDLNYVVEQAADGEISLRSVSNWSTVVAPLSTLTRLDQDSTAASTENEEEAVGEADGDAPAEPQTPIDSEPPGSLKNTGREQAAAGPSFDCDQARTRGEIAVCNDAGLASLDRQMAAHFENARSRATPAQRALLQRTGGRFRSYRDACRSDSCIADAYRARMREMDDIMADRWQGGG